MTLTPPLTSHPALGPLAFQARNLQTARFKTQNPPGPQALQVYKEKQEHFKSIFLQKHYKHKIHNKHKIHKKRTLFLKVTGYNGRKCQTLGPEITTLAMFA